MKSTLFVIAIITCLIVGFQLPALYQTASAQSFKPPSDIECTVQSNHCEFNSNTLSLEHQIASKPNTLSVSAPNAQGDSLLLEVRGVEMDMGIYRLKLMKDNDGLYKGEMWLPACLADKMTWQGTLTDQEQWSMSVAMEVEK